MVKAIMNLYCETKSRVKTAAGNTEEFNISVGVCFEPTVIYRGNG